MAASLTKEQLKNELISHGIQLPSTNARKEEYVKLYEQHVAPVTSQKGDFSSDDENEPENKTSQAPSEDSLVFDGVNIASYTDEQLYEQLKGYGIPIGPIVDSTRLVYQRKLASLLKQNQSQVEVEKANGISIEQEEIEHFSDTEEEEEKLQQQQDIAPKAERIKPTEPIEPVELSSTQAEPMTSIRQRVSQRPPSSLSALPLVDRQGTPTPRPSIRTVTSSTRYTFDSRRLVDTIDGSTSQPLTQSSSTPKRKWMRVIIALLLLAVLVLWINKYADITPIKQWLLDVKLKAVQFLSKAEEIAKTMDKAEPNPIPDVK